MKRIFGVVMAFIVVGTVASVTLAANSPDSEAAPLFGIKIFPEYRDWRLISVAHEEGNLNDLRAVLGNDVAIKAYRGDKATPAGRHSDCSPRLGLHLIGRKQQSLWSRPIIRARVCPGLVSPVHGQGLKKILRDGRMGLCPV